MQVSLHILKYEVQVPVILSLEDIEQPAMAEEFSGQTIIFSAAF